MSASADKAVNNIDYLNQAIKAACDSIAPTWPLDRMIAVNPYWGRVSQPFREVGASLARIAGSTLAMPLSYYRDCWQTGRIQEAHLEKAVTEKSSRLSVEQLIAALDEKTPAPLPAPLLCDRLDRQRDLRHEPAWCDTITHQVAQFCAAYFDCDQADWRPDQTQSLYGSWRAALTQDHSVALLMKASYIPGKAKALQLTAEAQIANSLAQLGIDEADWCAYLQAVLMRVSGWAAWCAYRRWQAQLHAGDDCSLVDLLAIRLAWETLIDDGRRHQGSVWNLWQRDWQARFQQGEGQQAEGQALEIQALWQRAHEISYQRQLCDQLLTAPRTDHSKTPTVQAVFCIDVRSEVFRRHLEAQSDTIQTLGFAGFFGLPISYTPLGTDAMRPQLPGLLAPAINISDSSGNPGLDRRTAHQRQRALKRIFSWRPFQSVPASAFTLVEALGLSYAGKLIQRSLPGSGKGASENELGLGKTHRHQFKPTLTAELAGGVSGQAAMAAQVLRGMNLTEGFAPLVLLIGHGSQNENNPQRAGLDCGACCGQTGEVNSRALAGLLNDPQVRQQLEKEGITIPERTRFIAGLHNTTTDEVRLFATEPLASAYTSELHVLRGQLAAAGRAARQERAPMLGLGSLVDQPDKLSKAILRRANDWAQTRPEWGLANNAAFIVAPRYKTRGVALSGRSFLHDYDYRNDPQGALLEQIMTAPMIVTHWINMQYFASTVDNKRYGSGNKTLHNVVGGRLGVFEGNGGDLRIGLAWQSVHDGEHWRHEPLRLTVVIDAPRRAIEAVISKHDMVQNLVDNQWLYLARWGESHIEFYHSGQWQH